MREKDAVRFLYPIPAALRDRGGVEPVPIDLAGTDPGDSIARIIAETGTFYEAPLLEHLAERGPLGGIYLDVGANIGNHAVYFARFLADFVVAVEPNPQLLPLLSRNLRLNGRGNWTVVAAAAGAAAGWGRLRPGPADNVGGTKVVDLPPAGAPLPSAVPLLPLDTVVARLASCRGRAVTLVKLDIEGMELAALRGAETLLRAQRPQLVVEVGTTPARRAIIAFLAAFGYRVAAQFVEHVGIFTYHFVNPVRHELRGAPTAAERWFAAEPEAADRLAWDRARPDPA